MLISEYADSWALITGASAGIGREFAKQLAGKRMNLVLVARREHLLNGLKEELLRDHPIQIFVVPADLSDPDAAARIKHRVAAENINVRLLCNNAAVGRWGSFDESEASTYHRMIQINAGAIVALCHHFLPDLTRFPTSVIINVASPAGFQPVPYMSVYAGTKAFVSSFSLALYGELKDRGVLVQTLIPGPTESEFDTLAGAYPSVLKRRGSPAEVVRDALLHLERETPLALNARGTYRQRIFASLFPPGIVVRVVAQMFRPPSKTLKR